MQILQEALQDESIYPATDHIGDIFVSVSNNLHLKKNQVLIDYDEVCKDIFVVKSGCIRGTIINPEGQERTVGFGMCGSLIYSAQCFIGRTPSIYRYLACCPTEVLCISKKDFDRLIDEDHEFCRWIMGAIALQIYYTEMRNENLNGDAAHKYRWLSKKRPELLKMVSDKIIASYLNITEVHLSRIKKELLHSS